MSCQDGIIKCEIRNYSIAAAFIIFAILMLAFFVKIFLMWESGITPANIWSECNNRSANVFIGASEDLKNVRCVALDKEFFANPEIVIGDLSKNDEDVCRFVLSKDTAQPLRFEVWYNGRVEREVCNWQNYPQYSD